MKQWNFWNESWILQNTSCVKIKFEQYQTVVYFFDVSIDPEHKLSRKLVAGQALFFTSINYYIDELLIVKKNVSMKFQVAAEKLLI